MNLSPVTGTEVPETANGVVTPVSSENGPHVPVTVKCGGSRVPCSGDPSQHTSLVDTVNHIDVESGAYDADGHLDMYKNERTPSLPSHTSHVTEASLPAATLTGGTESNDTGFPEDSKAVKPSDAAPLRDLTHPKHPHQGGDQVATHREPMEAEMGDGGTDSRDEEEEDGEKEKQDEEEDEKNENKWIHQRAGGRAEAEVSGLNHFQLY